MKTAVVIGATGLIGWLLVEKLAQDGSWSQVLAITRKQTSWNHPKIRTIAFDFVNWETLDLQIKSFAGMSSSLDFFCTLGTTIKTAGSQEAFKKVDHDAVTLFAQTAVRCGAESLLIVSSLGADPNSSNFYSSVKGLMEKDVLKIKNQSVYFLRPSLLLGERTEFRLAERLAMMATPIFSPLLVGSLAKYRPVYAAQVANTMVRVAAKKVTASSVIENDLIHKLGS